jgi:hypothetical protein
VGGAEPRAERLTNGEVVEWLKAPASKAGERDERSVSSNLTLSAMFTDPAMCRVLFTSYGVGDADDAGDATGAAAKRGSGGVSENAKSSYVTSATTLNEKPNTCCVELNVPCVMSQ